MSIVSFSIWLYNPYFFVIRRCLVISLLVKGDLISVWKKVHAMKWLFIYRRDLVECYVYFLFIFLYFFISFKNDSPLLAERMIVQM